MTHDEVMAELSALQLRQMVELEDENDAYWDDLTAVGPSEDWWWAA